MKKEDREKNRIIENALKEIVKSKIKQYKFRKRDYMIYMVKDNMIYGLFIDSYIRETDSKPIVHSYIEYKPLWIDDLLWEILDMKSNKHEPDSLRIMGAFTVPGMEYSDDTIEFDGNVDTLEKLIDGVFKNFENNISLLTNEKYIGNIKETGGKRVLSKALVFIHENNYTEAKKILEEHKTEYSFIIGDKTSNELMLDYINSLMWRIRIFDFELTEEMNKIAEINKNKSYYEPNPELVASYATMEFKQELDV